MYSIQFSFTIALLYCWSFFTMCISQCYLFEKSAKLALQAVICRKLTRNKLNARDTQRQHAVDRTVCKTDRRTAEKNVEHTKCARTEQKRWTLALNATKEEGKTGSRKRNAQSNGNVTDEMSGKQCLTETKRDRLEVERKMRSGTKTGLPGRNRREMNKEAGQNRVIRPQHQTQPSKLAVTPEKKWSHTTKKGIFVRKFKQQSRRNSRTD